MDNMDNEKENKQEEATPVENKPAEVVNEEPKKEEVPHQHTAPKGKFAALMERYRDSKFYEFWQKYKKFSPIADNITRQNFIQFFVSLSLIAIIVYVSSNTPAFIQAIELKVYDVYMTQLNVCKPHDLEDEWWWAKALVNLNSEDYKCKPSDVPAILDIDEKSMSEYGQWPWPRYLVAQILDKVHEKGVLSIGLDILFTERDGSSPYLLQQRLKKNFDLDVTFNGLPDELLNNDVIMAKYIKEAKAVPSFYFVNQNESEIANNTFIDNCTLQKVKFAQRELIDPMHMIPATNALIQGNGLICPIDDILNATTFAGFNTATADKDGVVRKFPLFMSYKGTMLPSLPMATLMAALESYQVVIATSGGDIDWMSYAKIKVPLDGQGSLYMRFKGGPNTFPHYSVVDFMNDKIPDDKLEGKLMFLGSSASGLYDIRNTPVSQYFPGVETNAVVLDNILTKDFVQIPSWAYFYQVKYYMLYLGIFLSFIMAFFRQQLYIPLMVVTILAIPIDSIQMYLQEGYFVNPFYGTLLTIINIIVVTVMKYRSSEKGRQAVKDVFSKYVSPDVVSQILQSKDNLMIGRTRELTIFFSDIRSFTTLSENMEPQKLVDMLNIYFSAMTDILKKSSGTLDKFIGDAVMAFWNAPIDVKAHPDKAVQAALDMIQELDHVNELIKDEYNVHISIGIGIHTGPANVGNMGSNDAMNYTIIGDSVNLASRLEGLTKQYSVRILLSESTVRAITDKDHFTFICLDKIRVKGKDLPVVVYTVLNDKEKLNTEFFDKFERARLHYDKAEFQEAKELLTGLHNDDFPILAETYLSRCEHLLEDGQTADGWDGVYTFKTK